MRLFSKKSLAVLGTALFISSATSAACFQFVGESPQRLGNISFSSKPKKVCLFTVTPVGGTPYKSLQFSDAQGDLAQFAAQEISRGRCGSDHCAEWTLLSGNNNGSNVNPAGINVNFTETQITIKAGRAFPQTYPIQRIP